MTKEQPKEEKKEQPNEEQKAVPKEEPKAQPKEEPKAQPDTEPQSAPPETSTKTKTEVVIPKSHEPMSNNTSKDVSPNMKKEGNISGDATKQSSSSKSISATVASQSQHQTPPTFIR